MPPATSLMGLMELEARLEDITRGLKMEAGSLFRVACQYLSAWGVELTSENEAWIQRRSEFDYFNEWESSGRECNAAIERAIKRTSLKEEGNALLNTRVAEYVVNIMLAMNEIKPFTHDDPFRICDLGAGTGDTTIAVLDVMEMNDEARKLAPFIRLCLVEPSNERLFKEKTTHPDEMEVGAAQKLKMHSIGLKEHQYELVRTHLTMFLGKPGSGWFDMVISSSVLHHFSFTRHLMMINEKLAENGVMVTGDWHSTNFSSPVYLIPVLRALGASDARIGDFKRLFGLIGAPDHTQIDNVLPAPKRLANEIYLEYQIALAEEMAHVKRGISTRLLEAYESIEDRLDKYRYAGFSTGWSELSLDSRFANLKGNVRKVFPPSEIAYVVAVAKPWLEGRQLDFRDWKGDRRQGPVAKVPSSRRFVIG